MHDLPMQTMEIPLFNSKQLLEVFFDRGQNPGHQAATGGLSGAGDILAGISRQKAGTFAAGAATGGLIGLLLGSRKVRKIGGGLLGYGGAAVLGGLAYKAWQNYQNKQASPTGVHTPPAHASAATSLASASPGPAPVLPAPTESAFDPNHGNAADGRPFALALMRAMIAAVKVDGHIDAREQSLLHARIEAMALDAEAKAFVFDELGRPVDLDAIAALPRGPEQAVEIWLASRLVCDPDDAREKTYLTTLAAKLKLPSDLLTQLEEEVATTSAPVAVG